ncbi:MAG: Mov34/MPN/PAD-1 family protein [Bacteroidia bacterium]
MVYSSDKFTLTIHKDVLSIFESYIQDTYKKNESGGILLGQLKDNQVYLIRASVPNKFDKASRHNFERDKIIAQIIVDNEFANSNGKTIYIGEWHTHPEDKPLPSGQDERMIKDQLKLNKNIEPYLFMIIQGIKSLYVGIYDGKKLTEMKNIKDRKA